ncbi:MAG: DNA topoisomerase 4 subunit A [Christensenellaceae bacterium]|jgi:DNA gyrase subunit A|nr:DNA topoisomerase 4 subunit A [Christensenellaceae bacterium]
MKDEFDDLLDPNSEVFLPENPDTDPQPETEPVEVEAETSAEATEEEKPEPMPEPVAEEEPPVAEEEPIEEEPVVEGAVIANTESESESEPEAVVEEEPVEPEPTPESEEEPEAEVAEPVVEEHIGYSVRDDDEEEESAEAEEPAIEEQPLATAEETVEPEPTPGPEEVVESEVVAETTEPEPEPEPTPEPEQQPAEPVAVEEPQEEQVTEHVIEEVKEKVKTEHPKPSPKRHDTEAEQENAPTSGASGDGTVIFKNIDAVMHDSMIPYSEFVIMDRALPRVEDGLKPVQRRILYAMNDMGLTPDKPFRKSAGIVGECLGKYHPHGDTSVYDAMVRLAQPFNMNMPLVIGQGNFGSDDGDPPAAMRYTEAKLSALALELLRDIDKETVPFSLTFDDRNTEPDILPGRYPNLLTNGATGIAVGLATNIPPHNLAEVIDAHVAYIDNPKITLAQVMKIIKGPDFPTGGFVICGEDLLRAYKDGKGKVIMRAKVNIEVENDRRSIVITELPYQVNKVTLQKNIADLRETKKGAFMGISEIRDESDRNGMRVVIKVKREFDAKEICEMLFKSTNLQCNYNINMVAIANGKPKLMGLMEFIKYYVEYQREIVYKRSVFDLENARERAHILEGLLIAIRNIDEVVRIIKTSKNTGEARDRLMSKFKLSERQAQAILDLRLARLTSLEVYKIEEELKELKELIAYLEKLIASKPMQFGVVKTELLEIRKKYKVERRSRILTDLDDAAVTADDDPKPVDEAVVALTAGGAIKRMAAKHFNMSKTEFSAGLGIGDVNQVVVQTQTDKQLFIFTNLGNCYKIDVGDIPECKLRDRGISIKDLFGQVASATSLLEKAVAAYAVTPQTDEIPSNAPKQLVWLTDLGMIKRSTWADACSVQKSTFQCYKLREDKPDSVVNVSELNDGNTILFISSGGYILNAMTGDIPVQGRIASGVKGIAMGDEETAVCSCLAKSSGFIVSCTSKGNLKRMESKKIDKMVRYRKGLQLGGGGERVVFGTWVKGDEDLVMRDDKGNVYSIPVGDIPISDRTGKWRTISKLKIPAKTTIAEAFVHQRKGN